MAEARLPNVLNLAFAEAVYADFVQDRASVPEEWRKYFEELQNGEGKGNAEGRVQNVEWGKGEQKIRLRPSFQPFSIFNPPSDGEGWRDVGAPRPPSEQVRLVQLQDRVDQLVRSYRSRGHMVARINPLGLSRKFFPPELNPEYYGFTIDDMDRVFSCETIHPQGPLTLAQILDKLWNTYCRSIGVEYMHIDDRGVRKWLQERMERAENRVQLTREEQLRILTRLTDAVTFEEFIRKKFIGAKTFSLEGSESLIPLLDLAIERAGEHGIAEIVIAMAHRGRLNVLANIMRKSPRRIFREFADIQTKTGHGFGDVKYHLGHSCDWKTLSGKQVHLSLCFNPSHLEFVDPVAVGRIRAKQDRVGDSERERGMVFMIHGDAAFAGEGVIQETLNLSQLRAYAVGGTLHVIVNNQIGFTTGPDEARSSTYATDVAKMLQIPIFHVNGEDPEAVAQVVRVSMDFRREFKRDVVIDMYGYRRLGHNETDEPAFTQPMLYRTISDRKSVREGYLGHLLKLGGLTREEADHIAGERQQNLERELSEAQKTLPAADESQGIWKGFDGGPEPKEEVVTAVEAKQLQELLERQTELPADFHPHPKIKKLMDARREMARGKAPLDWAHAEALAFASLAVEGHRVRLTGQDTARGTFSSRHAVLHDYEDGHTYVPLENLAAKQAPVEIYNSPLSETGVLGFEYGYSLDYPDGLVLWEAQFGDFVNAAQVIVDQFIASAEEKWHRLSGLVLLLPHGFEGQGPEHSSARLERFLELAANDNIQVVYPTTPAQYFHVLRRQVLRRWRKPLVIMTPKSLLRHPKAVSSIEELAKGKFEAIISDDRSESVRRVVLCSGKIYYELQKHREEAKRDDVAIIRMEQLYPLRIEALKQTLSSYKQDTPMIWVQEEPENMGAWRFIRATLAEQIGRAVSCISRPAAATPATGSANRHKREQAEIITAALNE